MGSLEVQKEHDVAATHFAKPTPSCVFLQPWGPTGSHWKADCILHGHMDTSVLHGWMSPSDS